MPLIVFVTVFILQACVAVGARPAFAIRENQQCGYCHVRPGGGGERNYRGKYFAQHRFSFAGFEDFGATGGAVREMWRQIMPRGSVAFDTVEDNGPILVTDSNDGKRRQIAIHRWDGGRFTAEAVVTPPPAESPGLWAFRSNAVTGIAVGSVRYRFDQGSLSLIGTHQAELSGRTSVGLLSASRGLADPTAAASLWLTAHLSATSTAKRPPWTRPEDIYLSTLKVNRYTAPVLYIIRDDRLVAVDRKGNGREVWRSADIGGRILDLRTGDPLNEGTECLLALVQSADKRENPVLIAFRQD